MHLVMFDIDGTLVQSCDFDSQCYVQAVQEVLGFTIDSNWARYRHVSDTGILNEIISDKGLDGRDGFLHRQVKDRFIEKIEAYLNSHGISQVAGASQFISLLRERDDIAVAIATGGWRETALLKLEAAGINCTGIALASSSDHDSRIEIMKAAERQCGARAYLSKTYFGDAQWDKAASGELGYEFVLVGDRICHNRQIADFQSPGEVLSMMGLQVNR